MTALDGFCGPPTLFAAIGTDHHRFDRLVGWLDQFAARGIGGIPIRVTVQYGHSTAPRVATGVAFLSHQDLAAAFSAADVVVVHGGPGSLTEAMDHARVVCVPRDPRHGEHVDDHQIRFARFLAARGSVTVAENVEALQSAVIDALAHRLDLPAGVELLARARLRELVRASSVARAQAAIEETARLRPSRRQMLRTVVGSRRRAPRGLEEPPR